MAATSAPPAHRPAGYKVVASLAVIAAAAAVTGLATFGTFTDSSSAPPVAIQDGTVSINLAAGDGSASVPLNFDVHPGGSATQAINLINDGDSGLASVSLATAATTSSILDTDKVNGLQMTVASCSVAWAPDFTCSGTQRTLLASGPAVRTANLVNPWTLSAGATDHLAVTMALPATAGDAFQSQTSDLTLTFTATQRDGTSH